MKRLLSLSLCIVCFTATAQQQIVTCQFPIEIENEEEGLDLVWNTGDAGSSLLVIGPGHYSLSAITTNRLLDGTGQGFMEVQEISGYESDGHTAAVWVNPSSVSGVQDLISKDGECVERQWLLTLQNGAFMAHVWLDGGGSTQFATGNIAVANEWMHVAQVWDGEILRLFINGQLYDAEPCIGTLVQGDEPLRIAGGAKFNCNAYESDCLFDDVAFWDRGLTEEEIGLVYARQQEVFDDCLSRWTFEGDNPLFDSGVSGNQNSTNSLGFLDVNEEDLIAEYEVIELDCAALASICGPGTLWDSEAQTCIVANPADINFDGCVQLNDLLDLLSAYGNCGAEEVPWQCGDPLAYQGYDYATVQIGEQCWLAENLRNELYQNGDSIQANLSDEEWGNTDFGGVGATTVFGEPSFLCEEFSPDGDGCDEAWSLTAYGRLYNWYAINDARGLCPAGWHVPSDDEWTSLTDQFGGLSNAGDELKSASGWHQGGNGSNVSEFSALPGGIRNGGNGSFQAAGTKAFFWTATETIDREFTYLQDSVSRQSSKSLKKGMSVRCIKDAE